MWIYSGGSGEVTFNTKAEHYIYNEKSIPLVNIFENLDDQFVDEVKKVIAKWQLSKENKQEFLALRKYYNDNLSSLSKRENAVILYCLLTHAFNYQIAFNSKGEYNMPSGAGRSYFSPQLEEKLKKYIEVKKGERVNLVDAISAVDACSNVIPDKIKTKGHVYNNKPGKYIISYIATDAMYRTDRVDITVTVV